MARYGARGKCEASSEDIFLSYVQSKKYYYSMSEESQVANAKNANVKNVKNANAKSIKAPNNNIQHTKANSAYFTNPRLIKPKQCALVKKKHDQFEKLVTPCVDSLYTQAMRLTNNAQDAQDLVQDTFERALKSFSTFQPGTNFAAWINRIERNLYFNQYAKEKRRPKRANDATGEYDDWDIYEASNHSSSGLLSAEQEYFEGFAPKEIMAALRTLPPERRKVFIEAAVNGKSYKQIAQEEGVKIGTVMSRLNRARTQLKRELADYADSD